MNIKKYEIKFEEDGRLVELNSESEFNQLKKEYNEYEFIKTEQMSESKYMVRKRNDQVEQPTLKDVLEEMRDFKKYVINRFDKIEGILEKHSEILARHDLRLDSIEGILEKHSDILARNNLK